MLAEWTKQDGDAVPAGLQRPPAAVAHVQPAGRQVVQAVLAAGALVDVSGASELGIDETVQHREEHGALQRKLMLALAGEFGDDGPASGLLPKPFEHERRADAPRGDGERRLVAGALQEHGLLGESRARAQQAFELAGGDEFVEPAERGDDLLAHFAAGAVALDDLQVGASGGELFAEVHGANP